MPVVASVAGVAHSSVFFPVTEIEMHPALPSTMNLGAGRNSASAVLSNIIRDIQLVKSQMGEDKRSLRFIRIHRAHITLNGLISSAKEAFADKDITGRSFVVQFRDSAGDFVTLRDDMEIVLLDLGSLLGQTVLKFLPVDDKGQFVVDEGEIMSASSATISSSSTAELQKIHRRLTNVEKIAKDLSDSFDAFRRAVLNDPADISSVKPPEPIPQPSGVPPFNSPSKYRPPTAEIRNLTDQFALLPLPTPVTSENGTHSAGMSKVLSSSLVNIPTPPSIFPEAGGVFARFTTALNSPAGPDKMTLLGKETGDRMFVSQQILMRAVQEAELVANGPERGGEIFQFAKSILTVTAEDLCGCSLQSVLQDMQKASGKEVVLAFCTSSGNRWMKILHHWAATRWPTSGLGKNKFTQTMNVWIRAVCNGYATK